MIPYGRQDIQQADIDAVTDVLTSPFLTQGPMVPRFEEGLCKVTGANHAITVNSATSALHIAYMALDLGPGDWLWTSPNTFVATANAALYCGARVDFVDIDPRTYNLCAQALADKLERAKAERRLPKIVSVVQFAGQSANMKEIARLATVYGFKVVEDASHAIGGRYGDMPVGGCDYSDICVFSFHPVKIVTTAEGGAATTQDTALATKMELFRSHGVTRRGDLMTTDDPDPWYYEQLALGYNYRMTDLHAALGVSQLSRLADYVERRHEICAIYDAEFADSALVSPYQAPGQKSALHLYPIRVAHERRRSIFDKLRASGLGVNVHYIPVHTQPYYREIGFKKGDFPAAEHYYNEAISLPIFPAMTRTEVATVVENVKQAIG